MINPGKYNKYIKIVKPIHVENESGIDELTNTIILRCYASVKTTRGITLIKSGTDFEKAYTNFTIRFPRVPVTRDMLLIYKDKTYSIEYINNIDEEDVELELQCKEVSK